MDAKIIFHLILEGSTLWQIPLCYIRHLQYVCCKSYIRQRSALVCGVNEQGHGEKIYISKCFHDRQTGHDIISIIRLAECLNVNPWCSRIKTDMGDGRRRFQIGWWPFSNPIPWCILGFCGFTPVVQCWSNVAPISWCLTQLDSIDLNLQAT